MFRENRPEAPHAEKPYDASGGVSSPLAVLTLAVLIVTAAAPAAEAAGALFISRNAQPEELAIEDRLVELGFEVTRMTDAGEISAKLVRTVDGDGNYDLSTIGDWRIVLLTNGNTSLLNILDPDPDATQFPVAWVTSLIDPDLIAENEPQSLLTRGYGLYPIENGQEPTIGAFEIEGVDVPGVELHHLVSTWNGSTTADVNHAPYGVFSGSEVITW